MPVQMDLPTRAQLVVTAPPPLNFGTPPPLFGAGVPSHWTPPLKTAATLGTSTFFVIDAFQAGNFIVSLRLF